MGVDRMVPAAAGSRTASVIMGAADSARARGGRWGAGVSSSARARGVRLTKGPLVRMTSCPGGGGSCSRNLVMVWPRAARAF